MYTLLFKTQTIENTVNIDNDYKRVEVFVFAMMKILSDASKIAKPSLLWSIVKMNITPHSYPPRIPLKVSASYQVAWKRQGGSEHDNRAHVYLFILPLSPPPLEVVDSFSITLDCEFLIFIFIFSYHVFAHKIRF